MTFKYTLKNLFLNTIKLSFKELLNKEQIGISEPSPVTNLPVYLINSEQIGISEQFCDDQKVPNHQVWRVAGLCKLKEKNMITNKLIFFG